MESELESGKSLKHGESPTKCLMWCFCYSDGLRCQNTPGPEKGRSWHWKSGNIYTSGSGDPSRLLLYLRDKLVRADGCYLTDVRFEDLRFECHQNSELLFDYLGNQYPKHNPEEQSALTMHVSPSLPRISEVAFGSEGEQGFISLGVRRDPNKSYPVGSPQGVEFMGDFNGPFVYDVTKGARPTGHEMYYHKEAHHEYTKIKEDREQIKSNLEKLASLLQVQVNKQKHFADRWSDLVSKSQHVDVFKQSLTHMQSLSEYTTEIKEDYAQICLCFVQERDYILQNLATIEKELIRMNDEQKACDKQLKELDQRSLKLQDKLRRQREELQRELFILDREKAVVFFNSQPAAEIALVKIANSLSKYMASTLKYTSIEMEDCKDLVESIINMETEMSNIERSINKCLFCTHTEELDSMDVCVDLRPFSFFTRVSES